MNFLHKAFASVSGSLLVSSPNSTLPHPLLRRGRFLLCLSVPKPPNLVGSPSRPVWSSGEGGKTQERKNEKAVFACFRASTCLTNSFLTFIFPRCCVFCVLLVSVFCSCHVLQLFCFRGLCAKTTSCSGCRGFRACVFS